MRGKEEGGGGLGERAHTREGEHRMCGGRGIKRTSTVDDTSKGFSFNLFLSQNKAKKNTKNRIH